jgi:hypothetical protein
MSSLFRSLVAIFLFHDIKPLRHYVTSWKVAGSSPDEVDFFFQLT